MKQGEDSRREDLGCVCIPTDLFVHGIMTYIFVSQISCIYSFIKYVLSLYCMLGYGYKD